MNDMSLPRIRSKISWESCHADGMTMTKAARVMRSSHVLAHRWAQANGKDWPASKHAYVKPDVPAPLPPMKLDEIDARACQSLWAWVLLAHWRDVFPGDSERPLYRSVGSNANSRAREVALAWFGTKDFFHVAAMAGFDGTAIMDRLRARLGSEFGVQP